MNSSPVREQIVAFTDGAASGNPGPGGWAAVVVTPQGHVTELGGGAAHTTNNKMELTGAIKALEHIAREPQPVRIYTDSSYVIKGITQWVWNWQRRGWKTAEGGDVLNRDLWEQLLSLVNAHGRILGVFSIRDALPREIGTAIGITEFNEQVNDALG